MPTPAPQQQQPQPQQQEQAAQQQQQQREGSEEAGPEVVVGPAGPPVRPAAGPRSDTSPGAEGEGNHAAAAAVAQAADGELVAACTRAGSA
jgi:hypothetical protein